MIVKWEYTGIGEYHQKVKDTIINNQYSSIDVGGSINSWSYPECKTYVDALHPKYEDIKLFKINLEDENDRQIVLDYVNEFGKFNHERILNGWIVEHEGYR